MKYEVRYNEWNGREYANVTFENGSVVNYEIMKGRYATAKSYIQRSDRDNTLRQCGGRVPAGMKVVFDGVNVEFEEVENPYAGQFMEMDGWGRGEVVDMIGACVVKLQNVETGEIKAFNL